MCHAFRQYLKAQNISPTAFGKKGGIPQPTLSKYLLGDRIPRKAEMRKIYILTNGAVTPNDFYDLPILESEKNQLSLFGQPAIKSQSFPESSSHNASQNPCQQEARC